MRKLVVNSFVTLDGVMQAPGGPEEDTSEGFDYGGWSFHYWDNLMDQFMSDFMEKPFELLLGRKTYEIFAAHWPNVKNDPAADKLNSIKKYVVTKTLIKAEWNNSFIINNNIIQEIQKLKEFDATELQVHGSSNLIQLLLKNNLVDKFNIWTFPLVIGKGKKLFGDGTNPSNLKLVESHTSSTGVTIAVYVPNGEIKIGSFALDNPPKE